MSPGFKSFNNRQKFAVIDFISSLYQDHFPKT